MKVKIIKANLSTYWYAERVGEIFTVKKSGYGYKVTDPIPEEAGYYIGLDDAVEVSEMNPVNCKIDLQWLKGQAREIISEAIQKKLFEAGCKWNNGNITPTDKGESYLFVVDNVISFTNDKNKFDGLVGGSIS